MKGKYLLGSQLVILALLFYFSNFPYIFQNGFLIVLLTLSLLVGLYSFYNMGLDTFTPFPEPKKGSKHIQEGLYKYIRHPMYTAVGLLGLTLVLSRPGFLNTFLYIILLYVLDTKASYEEGLLLKLHSTYKEYSQKTFKFIPFIY